MNALSQRSRIDHLHALLSEFAPREKIKPGLERTQALCEILDHPERRFPCVHIAGSNGKGSVAALLANALSLAGLKTGLYTSPHLHRWSERIRINGDEIPLERLITLLEKLVPIAKQVEATVFELVTAVAFAYFAEQQADIVVVETGLGGRFDATNVVHPAVTIITSIDLDHTDILGKSLEEIAWEKAGIVKPEVPVVTAPLRASTERVVAKECALKNAPQHTAHPLESVEIRDFDQIIESSEWGQLNIRMLGPHQRYNVAVAISALTILAEKFDLNISQLKRGLEATRWPGRFDIISKQPLIILDGAHNPQGVRMLLKAFEAHPATQRVLGKRFLLFGVRADKDYQAMVEMLFPYFDHLHIVPLNGMRGLDPTILLPYARQHDLDAQVYVDSATALDNILQRLKPTDMLCVSGSLFLVGEARWQLLEVNN